MDEVVLRSVGQLDISIETFRMSQCNVIATLQEPVLEQPLVARRNEAHFVMPRLRYFHHGRLAKSLALRIRRPSHAERFHCGPGVHSTSFAPDADRELNVLHKVSYSRSCRFVPQAVEPRLWSAYRWFVVQRRMPFDRISGSRQKLSPSYHSNRRRLQTAPS